MSVGRPGTPSAASAAAARLRAETEALAAAVTAAHYAERPELLARFGAAGRERCHEDVRHTLEHLIPAVELGEPAMFAGYVRWLDALLRARRVDTADVVLSLELVRRHLDARLPAAEAAAVRPVLEAGLAVLAVAGAHDERPDGGS